MNPSDLRIVFMGTPDFAVPTLERLIDLGCTIVGVVSQPDRPKGRGRQMIPTPVAACARSHHLPLYQWPRLNNESFDTLSSLKPDLAVVIAYGKILPLRYLELPKYGCFNVHASLLPKLRGAAPIQWSVIRGHAEAGITIMRMDVGMDTGDIGIQKSLLIEENETSGQLHDRLAPFGADLLVEAIKLLAEGTLEFHVQDHANATMAPRLAKSDGLIDWNRPSSVVHDHIRGMSPWPGAFIQHPAGPLKIHASCLANGSGVPGEIIRVDDQGPVIACQDGAVLVTRIQRPGRKAVSGDDFMRGFSTYTGRTLAQLGC